MKSRPFGRLFHYRISARDCKGDIGMRKDSIEPKRSRRFWYVLLLLPFAGTLLPWLYSSAQPHLFGFPFFYWYQFLWIILGAAIVAAVHSGTREPR